VIRITFLTSGGATVAAPAESSLLRVSIREKGGIPFKCGGGLCGTCRCRIEQGRENTDAIKPKERKHLTEAELAEGWRMACQTFVLRGAVSVSWPPRPAAAAASHPVPAAASRPVAAAAARPIAAAAAIATDARATGRAAEAPAGHGPAREGPPCEAS
jgi:ferredoxin